MIFQEILIQHLINSKSSIVCSFSWSFYFSVVTIVSSHILGEFKIFKMIQEKNLDQKKDFFIV